MDKVEITDEYIEILDSQFEVWSAFLNNGVGLLAFTLAVASLGTVSPVINAWLSIVVVVLVRINGTNYFPSEIKVLRDQAKKDQKYQVILDGLNKKYFGFKTNFTKYHLFLFGFLFLTSIALTPFISKLIPSWILYIGV